MDISSYSDRAGAIIELESLSSLVAKEYRPYDLSFGQGKPVQKGRML